METHEGRDPQPEVTPPTPAAAPPEPQPPARGWLAVNGPYLVVIALAVVVFKVWLGLSLGALALVAVGLGLVIFIHELGHFLVAKWCDVHVETFSIGFGPALPGCSFQWGETTYMIAMIPLGGYVKMVGEGPESEEEEDDPRSFKNKPVWQRMAIISAGVTMNVLLGCVCFVVAYLHGVKEAPAVVGLVDVGSPAFEKGLPTGSMIERIGDAWHPYFGELKPEVVLSGRGEKLPLYYQEPGGPLVKTDIEPRRDKNSPNPVIGVAPPNELKLYPAEVREAFTIPAYKTSAAARAEPPFDFDDEIIATTDPEHPDQVKELPWDPRDPQQPHSRDWFEFQKRMQLLAGKPVTIRVQREHTPQPIDVHVPAAYHHVFKGVRMRMGKVSALREGSPGATAGVRPGDVLQKVEVRDAAGKVLRVFTVEDLDPLRVPYDLEQCVAGAPGPCQVTLTVLRPDEAKGTELTPVPWDDHWRFDREVPYSLASGQPIPGLGIAYQVETTVVEVKPGSQAETAGLRKDDVIREVRFLQDPEKTKEKEKWGTWIKLTQGDGQDTFQPWWAHVFWTLQHLQPYKQVQVRVKRDKEELPDPITLEAEPDESWPMADRGLRLQPDWRLQKAGSLGEAVSMGLHKTLNFIKQVYEQLVSMVIGSISIKSLGGPITIAQMAYVIASSDFYEYILFLGIISVNLAVINFLPIPVLDGGHMVFLIYEKVRGRPASEQVRAAATYLGLALILCLMGYIIIGIEIPRLLGK